MFEKISFQIRSFCRIPESFAFLRFPFDYPLLNVLEHVLGIDIIVKLVISIFKLYQLLLFSWYFFHKLFGRLRRLNKIRTAQTHQNWIIKLRCVSPYFLSQIVKLSEHFERHVLKIKNPGDIFLYFYRVVG